MLGFIKVVLTGPRVPKVVPPLHCNGHPSPHGQTGGRSVPSGRPTAPAAALRGRPPSLSSHGLCPPRAAFARLTPSPGPPVPARVAGDHSIVGRDPRWRLLPVMEQKARSANGLGKRTRKFRRFGHCSIAAWASIGSSYGNTSMSRQRTHAKEGGDAKPTKNTFSRGHLVGQGLGERRVGLRF